ncbi:unnamed protein product [Auanema sp. JU1783]|nr:unnamed protein product [Auanema sp. JU1783]
MSTFSVQHLLPSLPVPALHKTLNSYFISATANLKDDKQIEEIRKIVKDFQNQPLTNKLQTLLEERADSKRNWLEEWWLDSYMTIREPLIPFLSFGAKAEHLLPEADSQLHRASDALHEWLGFWHLIRTEQIPVFSRQSEVWDMSQYHQLFSSNRTPAKKKDVMKRFFKTEREGKSPTHVVVLYKGQVWKLEGINEDGKPKSPDEFYNALKYIKDNTVANNNSVISLTSMNRDDWAENYEHLCAISSDNKEHMQVIEESIMCLSLIDENEKCWRDLVFKSMLNNTGYQWADKSICISIYQDGQATMLVEHSNVDAIVAIHAEAHAHSRIRKELWLPKKVDFNKPKLLNFHTDDVIVNSINQAKKNFEEKKLLLNSNIFQYSGYGSKLLKKFGLFPDTVIQIALQIAFAKLHDYFPPIYETASIRKFYHGRTETVRGRSREVIEFGEAFLRAQPKDVLLKLFRKAYDKHNEMMKNSMNAQGVDRHLMGLRLIQETQFPQYPTHSLFKHRSWRENGGDGNFELSTSFVGYTHDDQVSENGNFCAPMCANGYGVFYRIAPNKLFFNMTSYRGSKSNMKSFEKSLDEVLSAFIELFNFSSL